LDVPGTVTIQMGLLAFLLLAMLETFLISRSHVLDYRYLLTVLFDMFKTSVLDRIRIDYGRLDPDRNSGGQKTHKKLKKS
jgi:hypothetical protein